MVNNIILIFLFSFFSSITKPSFTRNSSYNKEVVNYFSETAFYNNKWLYRWEKPILVECKGNVSVVDLENVTALIAELKPILGDVPIQYVSSNGNLIINFEHDLSHFENNLLFENEKVPFGFMQPSLNTHHQFLKANIYIHPSLIGNKKYAVLRHEFCHSLGLMSHTYKIFNSENLLGNTVFNSEADYEKSITTKNIPILDKLAIQLLYNKSLSLKYTRKDFERDYM